MPMATASVETQNDRAQLLRSLHEPGRPLVLCNVYDAATTHLIGSHPASKALATASFAVAATQGTEDDDMTLEQNLVALRTILPVATKYAKPVTVDIQDGYGDEIEHTIESVISMGAVGANLEDFDRRTGKLYSPEEAVSRVRRALKAATEKGVPSFVLNARTDVLLAGGSVEDAIRRGRAFLEAGATTVFVWGGSKRGGISREEVLRLVEGLDGMINVKLNLGPGWLSVNELKKCGVARISLGPGLYHEAMNAFSTAANGLLTA